MNDTKAQAAHHDGSYLRPERAPAIRTCGEMVNNRMNRAADEMSNYLREVRAAGIDTDTEEMEAAGTQLLDALATFRAQHSDILRRLGA